MSNDVVGSGYYGTDFQSGVPGEQQCKISGTDEGTSAKPGVPDVPKYDSESDKESWGDSGEEDDDDEDDTKDDDGDDINGDDDDDNDGNDDDDSDHKRTKLDKDENPNLNQFNEEHEEEEEENVDEFIDKEDDVNNGNEENEEELDDGEELLSRVWVRAGRRKMLIVDTYKLSIGKQKTEGPMQSSYVLSNFTEKLLNFENFSPANNEIASLMDTTFRHEEPSATTTPTPTTSEATTSFHALLDFSSVFKFNDRVTKLETDLSEMKQVDQHAQAISSTHAIEINFINKQARRSYL
ncbi:hypothetical protein Tco_0138580 [Tanacetum coccineum]